MIPKELHFVWVGGPRPWWAERNIERFIEWNPDFHVRVHGDEVMLDCFQKAYERIDENPSAEYACSRKADILRVCALLRYGGWYLDCDFLSVRPLNDLYGIYGHFPQQCFLTHSANRPETGQRIVANGVIGTTSTSPMLAMIATGIMYLAETERELGWDSYGAKLYTTLASLYPATVRIGAMPDFYRIENRDESMAVYKRLAEVNFGIEEMIQELGSPLPHMHHMAMEGVTEL